MRFVLALSSSLVAAAVAIACGGGTTSGGGPDGGAGSSGFNGLGGAGTGGGGTGGTGPGGGGSIGGTSGLGGAAGEEQQPTAHPPPDPGGPPAGGTTVDVLAVQQLFLGDTNRQLISDPDAWKTYGYDLDGHYSTKSSMAHCMPANGANPAWVKTDGNGGIDNSFGANLMPIVKTFSYKPTADAIDTILGGGGTYLFRFVGLTTGPNQSPVSAGYLVGSTYPGTPGWNGFDVWPVTAESVNGSASQPKVSLSSYVSNGTWVAHASAPLTVNISMEGYPWPLVIHNALVTAELMGSGTGRIGKNGIIAGVLDTEEVIAGIKKVAGALDVNLCNGATFDSIAQQFRAASDIMNDGSNGDSSQTCNGVSIGLGFESISVSLGTVAPPVTPQPDPCVN